MSSFPFFHIAQEHRVSYSKVLEIQGQFIDHPERIAYWSNFDDSLLGDVARAEKYERARRFQIANLLGNA